jgi:hypothetical protein
MRYRAETHQTLRRSSTNEVMPSPSRARTPDSVPQSIGEANPKQLACTPRLIGSEGDPEGGQNRIERCVTEGDAFDVDLPEIDRQSLRCCALAGSLEERGDEVDPNHVAPAPRGGKRGVAAAGRDAEHAALRPTFSQRISPRLMEVVATMENSPQAHICC